MVKTVIIFVLLGAILGAVAASIVAPPALGWYNEAGFLSQDGKGQPLAMVNLPQVIKYTSDRILKAQAIGAGIGAFTFLVLGLVSAGRRRRASDRPTD